MAHNSIDAANPVLIRGACLWMLMALILAWSLVGIINDVDFIKSIFSGSYQRVLQAHIDFLIMTSLILGFHASRVHLPWHVRWAMVVGAFTNSSLFMLFAIFPTIDPVSELFIPNGPGNTLFNVYMYASLIITSYGFGKGAILVLKSTFYKT
ncbi:MAG: hypothetical protein ABW201_13535 [Candidatus Thiodiazotropha sp.]